MLKVVLKFKWQLHYCEFRKVCQKKTKILNKESFLSVQLHFKYISLVCWNHKIPLIVTRTKRWLFMLIYSYKSLTVCTEYPTKHIWVTDLQAQEPSQSSSAWSVLCHGTSNRGLKWLCLCRHSGDTSSASQMGLYLSFPEGRKMHLKNNNNNNKYILKTYCVSVLTMPEPLQWLQCWTLVPGSWPLPSQRWQAASTLTVISLFTPFAAWVNVSSMIYWATKRRKKKRNKDPEVEHSTLDTCYHISYQKGVKKNNPKTSTSNYLFSTPTCKS